MITAMDMDAKLPSIGNFGPFKGKYLYKTERTYSSIAKKIGTIPAAMGKTDLNFQESKNDDAVGFFGTMAVSSLAQVLHLLLKITELNINIQAAKLPGCQ